ncbi:hypothetical protein [Micromonospora sp. KLBMP9576]|uniref:hypothetical protein n=1 Tax=Micromonospora sp. KLBMP9576 TaxID=3424769 RepID=UPI003D94475D
MAGDASSGAARELLLVLAVAFAGLLLALVAVFTPWHTTPDGAAPAAPVELRTPTERPGTTTG